jgi:hypothetical protein
VIRVDCTISGSCNTKRYVGAFGRHLAETEMQVLAIGSG